METDREISVVHLQLALAMNNSDGSQLASDYEKYLMQISQIFVYLSFE
jgi:hypothetical protein